MVTISSDFNIEYRDAMHQLFEMLEHPLLSYSDGADPSPRTQARERVGHCLKIADGAST